jgi:hypothetical protein
MTIGTRPLVSPTSIVDDWLIKVDALATFGRKNFIQPCWHEFVSNLDGRFALHLVNPNIFSPSKCDIIAKRLELKMYFVVQQQQFTLSPQID